MRSVQYKIDELAAVLCLNNIDICCITETWLNVDIPTEADDIDGYVQSSHSHVIISWDMAKKVMGHPEKNMGHMGL